MTAFTENNVQLNEIYSRLKDEVEQLLILLSERERYVIERRFALDKSDKATLEEIGHHYNVTRERIRQIENNALQKLRRNINNSILSDLNEKAIEYIKGSGGIIREDVLVSKLIKEKSGFTVSAILFILSLDSRFSRKTNTIHYLPHFRLMEFGDKLVDRACAVSMDHLNKSKDLVTIAGMKTMLGRESDELQILEPDALKSLYEIHKSFKVVDNSVGLITWKHIHPRTLRDKIFFILRERNKPMHFVEIANSIVEKGFDQKNVNLQAVHNELIRFEEFILIGRGLYALQEWGYKPGTVADVIENILKEKGAMSEDEIIAEVLKSRKVKKITIILNLKNSPRFVRSGRKRYDLKK